MVSTDSGESQVTETRKSILHDMAERYGVEPVAFEAIVRATCSPAVKKDTPPRPLTKEEFAAFLLVAKQYNLNPLTREIFAFPKRGGGVVPVVSVDGWVNLVNSHPHSDGFEFYTEHDTKGLLIAISCTQHRKDKSHPTPVTEYLSECVRDTDPWKMKHRMLRHKAFVQSARYAFGFAGIYDQDEAERIIEAGDVIDREPPAPFEKKPEPAQIESKPAVTAELVKDDKAASYNSETAEKLRSPVPITTKQVEQADATTAKRFCMDAVSYAEAHVEFENAAHGCKDVDDLLRVWERAFDGFYTPETPAGYKNEMDRAFRLAEEKLTAEDDGGPPCP